MNRALKHLLCLLMATLMLLTPICAFAAHTGGDPDAVVNTETEEELAEKLAKREEMKALLDAITYRAYREKHKGASVAGETVRIEAKDYDPEQSTALVLSAEDYTDYLGRVEEGTSIVINETGTVTWTVEVPKTGLYAVRFRYTSVDEFGEDEEGNAIINGYGSSAERGLKIDGE
ncbi:MAG: hypothetical protein IJF24_03520, partial [Clostridia bacterium]|nr:hypothetical protein [Clostridia bacterium]